MDWSAAIDKNREALKRILATLVAMAELALRGQSAFLPRTGGDTSRLARAEKSQLSPALVLPRRLRRVILGLLRPAEAAARRLIIVAARGLVVPPPRPRQATIHGRTGRARMPLRNGVPSLPLFDRLSPWRARAARPARAGVPRISVPGFSEPFPIRLPSEDDAIDASRLALRLQALSAALDDLPGHARRFARWRARVAGLRRTAIPPPLTPHHKGEGNPAASLSSADGGGFFAAQQYPPLACGEGLGVPRRRASRQVVHAMPRSRRLWPLRPGRPPGWRRKPVHEVHEVLDVVHGLAHWVLETPDTS